MQIVSEPRVFTSSGKNDDQRKKTFARSEDERRLLGDYGDSLHNSSAVSIPIPGQAHSPNTMRGMPTGFQPKNTLTNSKNSRQGDDQKQRHTSTTGHGTSQSLQLKAIRGNNVRQPVPVAHGDDVYEVPPAKRRKTELKSGQLHDVPTSSDGVHGIDPLTMDDDPVITLSRDSRKPSQIRSSQSQVVDFLKGTVHGCVKEYQSVEARMKSDPPKPTKVTRGVGYSQAQHTSRFGPAPKLGARSSSPSHPIDLSDDETRNVRGHQRSRKRIDQGRIEDPDSLSDGLGPKAQSQQQARDTGEQSHHFAKSTLAENMPHTTSLSGPLDAAKRPKELRLNDHFDTTEGKRRNAESSSSSDELASNPALQINHLQIPPPPKRTGIVSRSVSPAKSSSSTRKGSANKELRGLAPSSVPRSTFKHSAANKPEPKASGRRNTVVRESEPEWGIQLAAVNVGGEMLRSSNLGLQYEPNTASYVVIEGSQNLATKDASLQIQPQKLQKAIWSSSGAKIRLQSSKSGNWPHILDLELSSEKDLQTLLARLRENGSLLAPSRESDYLDRLFKKRLSEQRSAQASRSSCAVDEGEDIDLATHNKANRNPTYGQAELEMPVGIKKRRLDRTSDQMKVGKEEIKTSHSKFSRPNDWLETRKHKANLEREVSPSRISEITRSLQPKSRTARSPAANYHATSLESAPLNDEFLPEKLPQAYDLGEPWRKPLIYPKDGKKKATVEWTDLERLGEGEFFNDTLISFYLRYLEHQLEERSPGMARRFHFFNSFFYASLTNTQRGKKGFNYDAVQKWTRGVDIFTRDFVIVPINESLHWYLAVICNLPALKRDLGRLEDNAVSSPLPDSARVLGEEPGNKPDRLPSTPSSPRGADTTPQPVYPVQPTVQSSEEDARSSFAELSLDQQDKAHGQGVLGAHIRSDKLEASDLLDQATKYQSRSKESVLAVDASIEPGSPVAASSRKRKRKSIPPGKKLDPTEPAIITFDSLGVAHSPTVRALKDYLKAEAHEKRSMTFDDSQIKGMTAVGIPKQDNYCDCGPYLLGYMDKFLEDPRDFMEKIMRRQLDSEKDWPQLDPSNLRSSIRDLILRLHNQQEEERKVSAKKASRIRSSQKPESASSPDHSHNTKQDESATAGAILGHSSIDQVVLNPNGTHGARAEALQNALRVDTVDKARSMAPHILHDDLKIDAPTQREGPSVVIIDSQPVETQTADQTATGACVEESNAEESPTTLPSMIQDSQPQEAFQTLEDIPDETIGSPPLDPESLDPSSAAASAAPSRTIYSPPVARELVRQGPQKPEGGSQSHFYVQID